MMRLSAERLWILGGVVAIILVLAVGWFFMVSPKYDEASALNGQATTTSDQVTLLQRRLAELRRQNENMPAYLAQLAKERAALPSASGLSDLLRELQTAGDASGAAVSGVNVGGVADVSAGGAKLYALPLTLTVTGSVQQLRTFLVQLQQVQPRAVLITSASLSTTDTSGTNAGTGAAASSAPASSMSLSMKAFVAAGAADVAAAPSAPASTARASISPASTAPAAVAPSATR